MAVSVISSQATEPFPVTTIGNGVDCDIFRQSGFYRCSGANASAGTHMPTSSAFVMIVINRGGQEANQLAFRSDGVWVRSTGTSGFTAWKKLTPT